ncbi:class I SAM-dependent methyltransferase [bacterium]|nr:class I SAM-dependent methyltransferase [bacterium]
MSYGTNPQYGDCFDTRASLQFYLDLARETAGDVLELGVGTAELLFEIAKQGRDVWGIDRSPEAIKEAKKKRRNYYPEISGRSRLVVADMLSFDLGRRFGFVYGASSSIQGDSADDLRGIFRTASDQMVEGGTFAFDIMSPRSLRRTVNVPPEERELPGGRIVIRFVAQAYFDGDETTSFNVLYKEHIPGRTRCDTYRDEVEVAIITPDVIDDALDYAGLSRKAIYGDFARAPYDDESMWIVVVAEKDHT